MAEQKHDCLVCQYGIINMIMINHDYIFNIYIPYLIIVALAETYHSPKF